jgi:hypothetical protein
MSLEPQPPTPPDAPPPSPPPTPSPEGSGSLADHRAQFRGQGFNTPRLEIAEPKRPHKAQSRTAKPEDVEEINALTARLRAAEKDAGLSIERKEGESERVFNLRRQAEITEAIRDNKKAAAAPAPPTATTTAPLTRPTPPTAFADPEPTINEYLDQPDPYSAWQRAVSAYDRRKERWEESQATHKTTDAEWIKNAQAARDTVYKNFGTRVESFKTTTPDYDAVITAGDRMTPILLETALVGHPDGPRFLYELAKNGTLFDEFFLLTDQKPVTVDTVASVQRLLSSRMPVAVTGSTAAVVRPPAPRPPNPVRTVPQARGEAKPPGEGASLSEFRSYWGSHKRRS